MTKKVSLMLLGFVMMFVMLVGQENGPLSQMSQRKAQSEPANVADSRPTAKSEGGMVAEKVGDFDGDWGDEFVDPFQDTPLKGTTSFADLEIKEFNANTVTQDDAAAQTESAPTMAKARSPYFDTNPMPAGFTDTNFDPRL
ncbi:hypothetical protein [Erythrobacter ani]|uniref:Uncharacterized protein n=1 Tax=Erythrobacter ani TaxID=2827235 RepID=A0ABS6SMQ2_9SPHN|nr:hypothetical protein [Erythrobacter ani]MBV7266277.1 hypothetical protein [Erythrobacter ani]